MSAGRTEKKGGRADVNSEISEKVKHTPKILSVELGAFIYQ